MKEVRLTQRVMGSVKAADRFRKVRTDSQFLQVEVSLDLVSSSFGRMVV